ncbi:MAG: thiamine pyrophosphate-binding protein, partial [Pseudomonadota bacterium]
MITGADIIGRALAQAGCTRAFGIPGGEVLALMEGLRAAGLGFYLTKHETAAGFMAEGHWHATGAPGVLVATIGPGVANAVNVVANAHQDRVPMIFLTGCVDRADEETYTHQIFDHQAVLRPIVKGSFRAERGALAPMLEKALALALSGQPGPVHIDVPISVAEGETSERMARAPLVPSLGVEPGVLARLRAALERAERPLAIAGVDAVNEGAGPSIQAFCEAQNTPLLTTYKGKGLIDEAHPLCLGGHGLSPKSDSLTMPLIGQADLILLLGYDPIEMRLGWRDPWHDAQEVYEIAPVARDHGMHWVTETLLSHLAPCLDALVETPQPQRWDLGAPSAARDALQAAFAPRDGFGPGMVFATLRAALPPETVVTVDSGAHRILV